ncbi:hypothetical protein IHQ71_24925 [Rhizobium sp. TH2]|uniref:hypothetical protein n=1 Tax=Rhizobium sp. TH2 TaxID=2775403 RepID=UPI00215798DC|nr:hypothetical protein [Rhizobium sp. TH2]UVC08354.1 hypothetical protein IHQ71_24925 [Rhizobium sp. TH2]
MNESLEKLVEAARKVKPTESDHEQQRRSFAYGNTHFENQLITREMIDKAAEQILKETK